MHITTLLSIAAAVFSGTVSATSSSAVDAEMAAALAQLANLTAEAQAADYAAVGSRNSTTTACTKENMQVRKEW